MPSFITMEDYPEYIIKQRTTEEGEVLYYVKWIGCDKDDNTWESEEKMLAEWPSAVIRYKKQLGNKNIETRRPSIVTREEVFRYTNSVQDWESQVDKIAYVERSKVPGLIVYIDWKNGLKSVHHSTEVYAKCPQKMIEFFEKYTKFTEILADD